MAFEAGSVFVKLGALFSKEGFDRYDRAVKAARAEPDVETKVKLDYNSSEFDKVRHSMGGVRKESDNLERSSQKVKKSFLSMDGAAGKFNQGMKLVSNVIKVMKWPVMIAGATAAAQALAALGAGAVGLVSALAPLSGALVAYPALLTTAAQTMATVKLAFGGLGAAMKGNEKALQKLTPEGRSFVKVLKSFKPEIDKTRSAIQRGLFPGLEAGLKNAQPAFKNLRAGLGATGEALGGLAEDAGRLVGVMGKPIERVMASNAKNLNVVGHGFIALAGSLIDTLDVARPFTEWMARGARGMLFHASASLRAAEANGKMAKFFEKTRETMQKVGHIGGNLAKVFYGIGKAAGPLGRDLLDTFSKVTDRWVKWSQSTRGQGDMRAYFQKMGPIVKEIGRVIAAVGKTFVSITGSKDGQKNLLELGKVIRTDVLPAIEKVAKSTQGAFGHELITAIKEFSRLFATLGGANGPLTVFVKGINLAVKGVNWLTDNVPGLGKALSILATGAGIYGALKIAAAVTGISRLRKVIGSLRDFRGTSGKGGLLDHIFPSQKETNQKSKGFFDFLKKKTKDESEEAGRRGGRGLGGQFSRLKDWTGRHLSSFGGWLKDRMGHHGTESGRSGTSAIGRVFGRLRSALGGAVSGVGSWLKDRFSSHGTSAGRSGTSALSRVFGRLKSALSGGIGSVGTWLKDKFGGIGRDSGRRTSSSLADATVHNTPGEFNRRQGRLSAKGRGGLASFASTVGKGLGGALAAATVIAFLPDLIKGIDNSLDQVQKFLEKKFGKDFAKAALGGHAASPKQANQYLDIQFGAPGRAAGGLFSALFGGAQGGRVTPYGIVRGYATGGQVLDPRDNIPIMARKDEHIVTPEGVSQLGRGVLDAANSGQLGRGGKSALGLKSKLKPDEDEAKKAAAAINKHLATVPKEGDKSGKKLAKDLLTNVQRGRKDATKESELIKKGVGKDVEDMRKGTDRSVTRMRKDTATEFDRTRKESARLTERTKKAVVDDFEGTRKAVARSADRLRDAVGDQFTRAFKGGSSASEKLKKAATSDFAATAKSAATHFTRMSASVTKHTNDARAVGSRQASKLASNTAGSFSSMDHAVSLGLGYVGEATKKALSGLGGGKFSYSVPRPKALSAKARGGWLGSPNEAGPDDQLVLAAKGEGFVNRHQRPYFEKAMAIANTVAPDMVPFGSMSEVFANVKRKHSHASGGFVGKGIQKFAPGGLVGIPGNPGETIFKPILPALLGILRGYDAQVTDGYSPGHSAGSDHHWGGAVDLVARHGRWGLLDQLAKKAGWVPGHGGNPRPGSVFRWIGWNTEANHGAPPRPNAHLHLSWKRGGPFTGPGGSGAVDVPKITLKGPKGALLTIGQKSVDKARDAANKKIGELSAESTGAGLVGSLGGDAIGIAKTILAQGKRMGANRVAILAAIEAAFAESGVKNIRGGDRDSVGVFQQRPSQGWGSVSQIMNVPYAAMKFFQRAIPLQGRHHDPGALAQAVQRSAFPGRYNQFQGQARALLNRIGEHYATGGLVGGKIPTDYTRSFINPFLPETGEDAAGGSMFEYLTSPEARAERLAEGEKGYIHAGITPDSMAEVELDIGLAGRTATPKDDIIALRRKALLLGHRRDTIGKWLGDKKHDPLRAKQDKGRAPGMIKRIERAIKKLHKPKLPPHATKKDKAKYKAQLKGYNRTLSRLKGDKSYFESVRKGTLPAATLAHRRELVEEYPQVISDLKETEDQINQLRAGPDSAEDYITQKEKDWLAKYSLMGTLAELNTPAADDAPVGDPKHPSRALIDDEFAALGTMKIWEGVYNRAKSKRGINPTLLQSVAQSFLEARTTYEDIHGRRTASTAPTASEVGAQIASFFSEQQNLFGQFGSNFRPTGSPIRPIDQQAGYGYYGAVPQAQGGIVGSGGGTTINVTNNFASGPGHPHHYVSGLEFQLNGMLG